MLTLAHPREIAKQLRRYPIVVSITGVFAVFVFIVTLVSILSSERGRARVEVAESDTQTTTQPALLSDNGRPLAEATGHELKDAPTAQPLESSTAGVPRRTEGINTVPTVSVGNRNMVDVFSQKNSGDYTVQVGSFRNGQAAKGLLQRLKTRGYPVFLRVVRMPDKGTTHRVRVGTFENRDEAKRYGEALRKKEAFIENVFVTVRN